MQKLNIALVGCGGIAGAHVEGYKDLYSRGLNIYDVKAVCDISIENAESKAETIGVFQGLKPQVYTDLEDMFKEVNLNAVDICLPHNLHHTVACQCIDAGLHVIIEKPLGITMRAAKIILDKAKKCSRTLAVAENYRRKPQERVFWWAIQQGLIGDPRMILWAHTGWRSWPWGWREDKFSAGGSWVLDGGVHWADLDRYQLNREAVEVFAMNHTFDPVKGETKVTVDDMTMAIIRYEGDVYAQWLWTSVAPARKIRIHVVYGSKAALSDEGIQIQKENSKVESKSIQVLLENMREKLEPEELENFFPKGSTNTFAIEFFDFYDAIMNKRRPEVDGIEGYKDMAIPLGFYESTILGRPVKVKDIEEIRIEVYQKEINEKLGI